MENIKKSKGENNLSGMPLKALIKSVFISYVLTVIVFITYAILLTYTAVTEKNIDMVVMVTTVIAVLLAGFDTAKKINKKGWLWGMGAGFLYIIIMLFVKICISPEISFDFKTLVLIVLSLAGGGIGGIVGINARK